MCDMAISSDSVNINILWGLRSNMLLICTLLRDWVNVCKKPDPKGFVLGGILHVVWLMFGQIVECQMCVIYKWMQNASAQWANLAIRLVYCCSLILFVVHWFTNSQIGEAFFYLIFPWKYFAVSILKKEDLSENKKWNKMLSLEVFTLTYQSKFPPECNSSNE